MQEALPDLIYVPTHDPFAYTFDLVQPYLADGTLSQEQRQALRDYQDELCGVDGRLNPAAHPRFEKVGKDYGRVVADIP